MTDYILGNDQSWSGWGRCLATKDGPIWADHVANLGRKTYRWHALAAELARLDEMCPRPAEPGTIRLVAEKPPMKMSKQGSRRRGADVAPQTPASVFGMGILSAWIVLTVYVVILAACFFARFRGGKWKDMRVIEISPPAVPPAPPQMPATEAEIT